jgi:hypothetical protein
MYNKILKKNMKKITKTLIIIGIAIVMSIIFTVLIPRTRTIESPSIATTIITNSDVYNANYNSCLLYLMYSEDLLLKPSSSLTGQSLVSFGHAVKKGEKFNNNNYRKSFDLLQVDFCKAIEQAINLGYVRENNKQLSVALMSYNMKPKSVKAILADSVLTINQYCWYTDNKGKKRTSKNIKNNREFERTLYFTKGFIDVYKYLP